MYLLHEIDIIANILKKKRKNNNWLYIISKN